MSVPLTPKVAFPFGALDNAARIERIQSEFQKLHMVDLNTFSNVEAAFQTAKLNVSRNRYADILANEQTLFPKPPAYINANWIRTDEEFGTPHRFVAGQAPLTERLGEFYTAMVSNNITDVFMVTQERESGISKADRYWPDDTKSVLNFEGGSVTMSEEVKDEQYPIVRRKLHVSHTSLGTHDMCQVQFLGWPDHGVPKSADAFQQVAEYVRSADSANPIFVHCSAGVGRTGTLIAVYTASFMATAGTLTDRSIFDIVKYLKTCRTGSVQRPEQYAFIYNSTLSFLSNMGP